MTHPMDIFPENDLELGKGDFLTVLSILDEGVLITNINGVIVFYNQFHGIIDGLDPKDVIGRPIVDIYNLNAEESLVMRCLKNGRPIIHGSILYKARNGRVVNSINSVFPIKKAGQMIGCISFLKDYKILKGLISPHAAAPGEKTVRKDTRYTFENIIGASMKLLTAVTHARKAADSDSPIMLYGETGTGKEMFAQSVHHYSRRNTQRYVAVNCASIPESLFEGLLFGTVKGAFTNAMDKKGLFEQANGGTLFLDEIDAMPNALQAKLLRAIQEKKVRRVGSLEEIPVDIKIISSTNTSPHQYLTRDDTFRRDLFYRLAVVLIEIPPLREREDDISELSRYFLNRFNTRMGKKVQAVSREVLALFYNYGWPGNVRELEHVIEGAMNLVENDKVLEIYHVSPYFRNVWPMLLESGKKILPAGEEFSMESPAAEIATETAGPRPPEASPQHDEKRRIEQALCECGGKSAKAAQLLGISRQLLYYRIQKHGIDRKRIARACEADVLNRALEASSGNLTAAARQLGISLPLLHYRLKKHGRK